MNTPYNSISAYELEAIMNYRLSHVNNVEKEAFVDNEYVLREWNLQKNIHLFKLLGEKLLYSEHVKFEKSNDQIYDDFDSIWYGYSNGNKEVVKFFRAFQAMFSSASYYRHEDEYRYLPYLYEVCPNGINLIDYEYLASNIYTGETIRIPTPDGKTIVIQNGSKTSKALKKIAEAYGLPHYEDFRISHSQIINDRTLEGDLVLSIHPLDYMTMSDNDCGWDSCMSWANDGEYRQGTVEMMNSPYVIVAYLTASNSYYMGNDYNWSNKKWRQLFIVNEDVITGIKGYPYRNDDLTKKVCGILKTLAEKNLGWNHYHSDIICYNACDDFTFGENNIKCKLTFNTCHMYNDFGREHFCYISEEARSTVSIHFSGEEECMVCGKLGEIEDSALLTCDDCYSCTRCDNCGCRVDEGVMIDGEYYCYDCANRIDYTSCDCCGGNYSSDNICIIYLRDNDKIVGETRICNACRLYAGTWRQAPISTDDSGDYIFDFKDCIMISQFNAFDIYNSEDYESLRARFDERFEKFKKI